MAAFDQLRFHDLPDRLLAWYEGAARSLPWRVGPAARQAGETGDPYRVWLAEIMLQQTTVAHATRYYQAFTSTWPQLQDLAGARDEAVMAAWAGLGYYARARNLLKCAREVVARGGWPETAEGLRTLPGIGPYTSGAIAALAFGEPVAAVDGNVERVFARLLACKGDWAQEKARIRREVEALVPSQRPGEFAEALMDLGATICTPRRPSCSACPLAELCTARAEGDVERYPIKPRKTANPLRRGHVFVLRNDAGEVLTEQRPAKGLLGGMLGLPGGDWVRGPLPEATPPGKADCEQVGTVRHVFTHFNLELVVWRGEADMPGLWHDPAYAADSLPSVFAKALKLALA